MSTEKKIDANKPNWKRLLNYHSIVQQVPFLLFLAILAVCYIYNGHYANKTIRDINKTERAVKELSYEYKTMKGELLASSKQSELMKAVEPLGLKELIVPPIILVDSSQSKAE
ncbi:MAG: hypothetical protein FJY16_05505 [Bacteroidetes bacterium]|nr:hypothetical protein [Bacteroidota bacterium]